MSDDQSQTTALPAEAPDLHEAEPETTGAAATEVIDPAAMPALDPAAKSAPVIAQDQWAQTARGVQEAIARDLKALKRLDELLSRPIWPGDLPSRHSPTAPSDN
jgi:hypothetical protein